MSRFFYLSHPEVCIDPSAPPPLWELSETGRARAQALADNWRPARVVSSPEPKALALARLLTDAAPEVLPDSGEIDRSATGYVPHSHHQALAEALFRQPEVSASGWETAVAAQKRVAAALSKALQDHSVGDLAMVGHGGVGTLLWMHISRSPIVWGQDQPRQGCFWQAEITAGGLRPVQGWQVFERFAG